MVFISVIIFTTVALSIGLKNSPGYEMFEQAGFGKELKLSDSNEISNFAAHATRFWKRDSDDENDIDDVIDGWEFWPPRIFSTTLKCSQEQIPDTDMLEPEICLIQNAAAAKIGAQSEITENKMDSETQSKDYTYRNTGNQRIHDRIDSEPKIIQKDASPKGIPALEIEDSYTPTNKGIKSKSRGGNSDFELALFNTDRSRITMFNERIAVLFPKLLRSAHDAADFADKKKGLESELQSLDSFYSWLIRDGNFLVHEISRPLQVTKTLFQSLVHRHSSMGKINAMARGMPEYKPIGEFHLKLVEFEIGLFEFLRPDTNFKNPAAKEFQDNFSNVRKSVIELREKFQEVVPESSLFYATFQKQLSHFFKVSRGFHEMIVCSSRKSAPDSKPEALKDPDSKVFPIQDIYQGSFESMD